MPEQASGLVRWSRARHMAAPSDILQCLSREAAAHRFWPAQLVVRRLMWLGLVVSLKISGAVGRSSAVCRNACTCRVLEACFLHWVRIGIASMQGVELGLCV